MNVQPWTTLEEHILRQSIRSSWNALDTVAYSRREMLQALATLDAARALAQTKAETIITLKYQVERANMALRRIVDNHEHCAPSECNGWHDVQIARAAVAIPDAP